MSYAVIKKSTHGAHVEAMLELATTPGLQRSRSEEALATVGDDFGFTIPYGRSTAAISASGYPFQIPQGEERNPKYTGISPVIEAAIIAGSAPLNKVSDTLHIPCGICVIVAGSGVGKTPLAHHLAGLGVDEYATVRVGEPFAGYSTNQENTAFNLGLAMVTHSNVVLDSIKDLLADSGNAMRGGISRSALSDLSSWATVAASLGTTIYIPLNPSGDAELIKLMVQVAESNATMTISHAGGSNWAYSSRTGEGLERISGSYAFERTGAGKKTKTEQDSLLSFNASKADPTVLAGVLFRSRTF